MIAACRYSLGGGEGKISIGPADMVAGNGDTSIAVVVSTHGLDGEMAPRRSQVPNSFARDQDMVAFSSRR